MARILRGDIVWADLNPVRGREQAGRRPVLILSHDIFKTLRDRHRDGAHQPAATRRFPFDVQEGKEMSKTKGTTRAGQSILQGAREALAFARGEKNHGCIVHVPKEIDVKAIRRQIHMSQSEFSRNYGFSKRSLEQWEQGRHAPTGAARVFLTVIAREPEAVQRALREPR